MTIPFVPTTLDPAELDIASRCIAHWRGEDLTPHQVSGQLGTFTRGATAALVDSDGTAFTAANQMPAFEPRAWTGGATRTHLGLLMGTSDRLSWAADWRPRALAFWIEFIEAGTINTNGLALWSVSNDAASGARLVVENASGFYRFRHHNGSAEVSVTQASAPTVGSRVVLRGQLYADGSVQCWQSVNGAAETATSRSSTLTPAATWGNGTARTRLNSLGTGSAGAAWFRRFKLVPGLPDYATLARMF